MLMDGTYVAGTILLFLFLRSVITTAAAYPKKLVEEIHCPMPYPHELAMHKAPP